MEYGELVLTHGGKNVDPFKLYDCLILALMSRKCYNLIYDGFDLMKWPLQTPNSCVENVWSRSIMISNNQAYHRAGHRLADLGGPGRGP
jgi:hypothetical protein